MKAKAAALALAMTAVVGCTPTQSAIRRSLSSARSSTSMSGEAKGRMIAPKRCEMKFVVLSSALNDTTLNEAVWSAADEQTLGPEVRRMLEANGLRVGLVTSDLPQQVQAMINAPPPHEVQPTHLLLPSGENTLLTLSPTLAKLSLLLNREGRVIGKDYTDVTGYMRLTASYNGPTGVAIRLVPELHHGPMKHTYAPDQTTSPFAVQQFVMREGQEEETLRELASTINLEPGQVAVIGCRPDHERSLGYFLMTAPEPNSDRLIQKVGLVWASRSSSDSLSPAAANPTRSKDVSGGEKDAAKPPSEGKAGSNAH